MAAALEEVSRVGFAGATVPAIAARAGTSVGNFYKYFSSKDELFEAAVPSESVEELRRLLRARVEALGVERDVGALTSEHPYRLASEALVRFGLEHRRLVLFLLYRAEGSAWEGFPEAVARELASLAQGYVRGAYPALEVTPSMERALTRIYRAFLGQIASILTGEGTEGETRRAIESLTSYHLAGLKAFFEEDLRRREGGEGGA